MSGFGLIDQDCYPHWNQNCERNGGWRGVRGCFSFTEQARFMVLLLFFFLIVKARGKNRNQLLGVGFSMKS